jgi:uncharacterized OsmC-like protein
MQNRPEMAKVTFSVKSEWNGGFSVTSTSKGFRMGGQNIEKNTEYKAQYDYPNQLSGEGRGPTVCESCMGALAACLTQTGISNDVRPGAQQFRVNMNIKSSNASKEQIKELYEIGKRFSPAFDTLTNGTSVVLINS